MPDMGENAIQYAEKPLLSTTEGSRWGSEDLTNLKDRVIVWLVNLQT